MGWRVLTVEHMITRLRLFWLVLIFSPGLIQIGTLVHAGKITPTSTRGNDLSQEIVSGLALSSITERPKVTSSTESQFDKLFRQEKNGVVSYDLPFPFTALTQRIASNLAIHDRKTPPLLQVLIPLGRSLQRFAADPEYFKYPRVIVAVDKATVKSAVQAGIFLRDRLYLGYQEKANTIEVISYNEDAGRFEFQVVADYGPGLTPRVSHASRMLCMSCHQNGGPIWSDPPWEETNVNPEIARLLQKQRSSFHGVPANLSEGGALPALRIGMSIDRAGLFESQQLLWQRVCAESARCRGDLFTAMLQFRLSGKRGYDHYSNNIEETLLAGWRDLWPAGLPIHSSRIRNRDPLDSPINLTRYLDPLEPRLPTINVTPSGRGAMDSLVSGLSEFLAAADIRILDDYLFEYGQDTNSARRLMKSACAFTKTELGLVIQIRFSCGTQGVDQMRLDGQFYIEQGEPVRGTIERLSIGESEKLIKLNLSGTGIDYSDSDEKIIFNLREQIGNIHVRLTDGKLLESLTFSWDELTNEDAGPSDELRRHPDNGTSVLRITDDFARLRPAITVLVKQAENGENDALSERPIRHRQLMNALFAQLGIKTH